MKTNYVLMTLCMVIVLAYGIPAAINNTISVRDALFVVLNLFGILFNLFNIHELRVKNMIDEAKKELREEIAKNKVVFQ